MGFRKDFMWGVGSASYQIEGGAFEDGKGPSIWDTFTHEGGHVKEDDTGDVACDFYHRYEEDAALIAGLGSVTYRFSISWPRIIPDGDGEVNQKGIDFYKRVIDSLLARGVTPCIILFHWDLPQALEDRGGWTNPESPMWFKRYTEVCAKAFGDKCKLFFTFNEPQCFIGEGYYHGSNAPGKKLPMADNMVMVHNVLLAHGLAVMALRDIIPDVKVGYAPTTGGTAPITDSPADVDAARQALFKIDEDWWMWNVPLFSDPVMLGHYPEEDPFFKKYCEFLPQNYMEDMKIICQPLDYYGQNIYYSHLWKMGDDGKPEYVKKPTGYAKSLIGWPTTPQSLYWAPKFLYERYNTPIIITENGIACHDAISLDGKVHDPNRVDYIHRYLLELRRAVDDGVDIAGYLHWSFTDNFEWCSGYTDRFGMVYVDYPTQKRIPKDSYYFYKTVVESNGENL